MMPETPQDVTPVSIPESPAGGNKPPFFNFTINTVLMILLLVGLVVMYFLFFSYHKGGVKPAVLPAASGGKNLSIVFVNTDSLNMHYEFVKVLKRDLESTGTRLQNEILGEQDKLQKEAAAFQQQVSVNAIPEAKAQTMYDDLMMRQQKLMEKKEKYTQMVADQELSMNIRLLDTIDHFLKRFNKKHGYDYIMAVKTAGEILIANDTLDITNAVLDELNQEYKQHNK